MSDAQARGWLQQPLLHFVVLGGIAFAIAQWRDRQDQSTRVIELRVAELSEGFASEQGRPPSEAELARLTENWTDRELLYREGLRLGLDRDDPVVKRRVVEKMEFVATAEELIEDPSDAELAAFVDAHQERYAGPLRRDFVLVTFAGEASEAQAQAAAVSLGDGADPKSVGGRVSTGKRFTPSNTRGTYGAAIADAIEDAALGQWHVFAIDRGWCVVRVSVATPGEVPSLDKIRAQVGIDYADTKRREAIRRRIDALAEQYDVQVVP